MDRHIRLKLKSLFLSFFLLAGCGKGSQDIAQPLLASEVGNGGHSVVCRDEAQKIISVRMLDFYEAKTLRDTHFALGADELSVAEKVKVAFERLSEVDAVRAAVYQERADKFLENTQFVPGLALGSTKDYGYINIPSYCRVEQFAIQKPPIKAGDKRYTVSLDLWDRADHNHRAGLVVHEIVYQDAIERGHKDSIATRYLTGVITSAAFANMDASAYGDLVERLDLGKVSGGPGPGPGPGGGGGPFGWLKDPIRLPDACVGQTVTHSFSQWVINGGGGNFSYRANNQPGWLFLTASGILMGNPGVQDIGTAQFEATVTLPSDPRRIHSTTVIVNVKDCTVNNPRVALTVRVGGLLAYNLNDVKLIPGGGKGFTMLSGPAWASISNGRLVGTPRETDVGMNVFQIQAERLSDGSTFTIEVSVSVPAVLKMPIWNQDPIDLGKVEVGTPFQYDLAPHVSSQSGERLVFRATNLPSWLTLDASGKLRGTPQAVDEGKWTGTVQVSDGLGTVPVGVFGEVPLKDPPIVPTCVLTATPSSVVVGEHITVSLVSTGATRASIGGIPVNVPQGSITVLATAPGTQAVQANVRGPSGMADCTTNYRVR